ncbi:carbohydrate sulfotransferase 15-like [Haliotis cracherodii]|uniref:carbohydrate sulfotransferase 15-like n=1 Tax=Haliotis cracherodii TaxID=6455 RepID=UPI0039E7E492
MALDNGTPQGSIISPTLFDIMINDLFDGVNSPTQSSKFADDGAIWYLTMRLKLGGLVLLMLGLCVSQWLFWYGSGMDHYETIMHMFSNGYVSESNRVNDTSVKLDIQCVGPGPNEAEDLFCMERPQYLSDFKNPCWFAKEDGKLRLRCIPYFHILGVCKSGTTDLAYRIKTHKDVFLEQKEIHYWCCRKYGCKQVLDTRVETPCNFSCYQQKFDTVTHRIKETTSDTGHHNMITGDATPADFQNFVGWPKIPQNVGLKKPVVLTPHLMRHVYTDPKFILIFRNPTDRLYSDYMMRGGRSAEDFHEAVTRDIQIEETCMKNHTVEHCLYSLDIGRTVRTFIYFGCYSVYMREWLKVFSREQFLILRTEDHNQDPKAQLRKVYNYLKLNYTEEWLSYIASVPHLNVSKKKKSKGPMLKKTRVLLDTFYSRYNRDLADILQDRKFLWLT